VKDEIVDVEEIVVYYEDYKSLEVGHQDFVPIKLKLDHSNVIGYISVVDKVMNVVVQKMMVVQNVVVMVLDNDVD
jgi:hypothetical protein